MKKIRNQAGFSAVEAIIIVVILGVIGLVGWRILAKKPKAEKTNTQTTEQAKTEEKPAAEEAKYIEWSFDGEKWTAMNQGNEPPACPNPVTIKSPIDVSKATAVLYPGQVRGGDFKPHGGLAATDNNVAVVAVMDAYAYRGARYIEDGEVQYLFDFVNPCGLMYRLDHLYTLSDDMMKLANQLPEPKPDESRTFKFTDNILVKQGTTIATVLGHVKTKNAGFDLGVFDLRQPNEASKTNNLYKTDSKRIGDKEQSFYAVCWFDWLTGSEKQTIKALPLRGIEGKTSDYCK